ncbi:MAG: hypothetical protein V1928_02650 [Parcubacteria group bacterium]
MKKIRKILHDWWLKFVMFYCPMSIKKIMRRCYWWYWHNFSKPLIYPTHKLLRWMDWTS